MASDVDICNLALAHFGDEANVQAIDPPDGSPQADHCARFYPIARGVCLESFAWDFAKRRASLTGIENPIASWAYAYRLPADYLKAHAVLLPESTDDTKTYPYVIETDSTGARILYTNVEQAVLVYTKLVTDTTKYTPLFISTMSWLLASYVSGPITKDPDLKKACYAMYLEELGKAAASNANASKRDDQYKDFIPSHLAARA